MIVKVFAGAECDWTYATTLANAMYNCQQWGARVVSMSLGGPGTSKGEKAQVDNMYKQSKGMLLFAASGNDYADIINSTTLLPTPMSFLWQQLTATMQRPTSATTMPTWSWQLPV